MSQEISFERCVDFIARMIEKYGGELENREKNREKNELTHE